MGARPLGSSPCLFTSRLVARRHGRVAQNASPSVSHVSTRDPNMRLRCGAIHSIHDALDVFDIATIYSFAGHDIATRGNDFAYLVSAFVGTWVEEFTKRSDASQSGCCMVLYLPTESHAQGSLGRSGTCGTGHFGILFAEMVETTNLCGTS